MVDNFKVNKLPLIFNEETLRTNKAANLILSMCET